MHEDPRVALEKLKLALERHLDAAATKRSGAHQSVEQAYDALEEAFLGYEEALIAAYDEYLPIEIAEDE
ncbi:MAG: hypothetical protein RIS51_67 [Actinomycetota bacterium]|jgi:predicted RNase H-like HicB family nuclease